MNSNNPLRTDNYDACDSTDDEDNTVHSVRERQVPQSLGEQVLFPNALLNRKTPSTFPPSSATGQPSALSPTHSRNSSTSSSFQLPLSSGINNSEPSVSIPATVATVSFVDVSCGFASNISSVSDSFFKVGSTSSGPSNSSLLAVGVEADDANGPSKFAQSNNFGANEKAASTSAPVAGISGNLGQAESAGGACAYDQAGGGRPVHCSSPSSSFRGSLLFSSPSPSMSCTSISSNLSLSNGVRNSGSVISFATLNSTGAASSDSNGNNSDEVYHSEQHASTALQRMRNFYSSGILCDVILVAENGQKFPAHRLVLSAASDYFAAMFTSGLAEATQSEVLLPHINTASLSTLLHYCYTGELSVRESNVESLLSTARQLLLGEVVTVCCDFLAAQLHPSNSIGIQLFADSQGCVKLQQSAQLYTAQHFTEVCTQQEFVQLRLRELQQLLGSDDLNVTSEETIMQAVMAWLEYDLPNRKPHCADVLSLVRLPLLSPQYISDCVESSDLFRDDVHCQRLMLEALKYHLGVSPPPSTPEDALHRARPRKSTVGILYLIGGMDASKTPVEILSYDYRRNVWNVIPGTSGSGVPPGGVLPGLGRRLQCGGAVVGGKLHIVGGRDGLKTLNSVECWDHVTGSWAGLPNMATHRHGLGVGVINGVVYSVGGHDGWSYLNTVERWDPGAKVWTYVSPMSTPRSSLGVAVLNGKLYAVGGRDGSACLRSVECYDPHTNRWTSCAPMHRRRGAVGVGVLNGCLYAIGGHDAPASSPTVNRLDCVERYDPTTDSWTVLSTHLAVGCDSSALCQLGQLLVCVGGFTGVSYLTSVQAYDPLTNCWSQLASLPSGRAGACAMVIM